MKKTYIMKTVCAMSLTAACAWGLAACSSGADGSSGTGGVAATVNGTEISEDTVTNYIEGVRTQLSAEDEEAWGTWLSQNGYTPASVREEVINSYAQRELIKEAVEEKGITVESSEIDDSVNQMKQYYDTDEKWQAALEQAAMTEESYRSQIELKLKENKLYTTFATEEEPSEADMLQYSQMYASAYDGAKRSSHILFAAEDEATAQEVLDKINSGELDFVDAVKEYSTDTASAEKDGDVGWDKTSSLDSDYTAGLDALEKDEVSGLVTSQFGIHIIKCTDVFTAPEEVTSVDQLPSEWIENIKASLTTQKQQEAYQQWLDEATEAADIKINDMPSGLPYDLDMSKYQTESAGGTDDAATTDGTDGTADGATDGAAEGDGTADSAAESDGAADGATDGTGAEQPAEAA